MNFLLIIAVLVLLNVVWLGKSVKMSPKRPAVARPKSVSKIAPSMNKKSNLKTANKGGVKVKASPLVVSPSNRAGASAGAYEYIDSGNKMRLERFGYVILISYMHTCIHIRTFIHSILPHSI